MTMLNEDDGELARMFVFTAENEGGIGVRCLDVVVESAGRRKRDDSKMGERCRQK